MGEDEMRDEVQDETGKMKDREEIMLKHVPMWKTFRHGKCTMGLKFVTVDKEECEVDETVQYDCSGASLDS